LAEIRPVQFSYRENCYVQISLRLRLFGLRFAITINFMDATIRTFSETEKIIALGHHRSGRTSLLNPPARSISRNSRHTLRVTSRWEHAAWVLLGATSLATIVLSLIG
jgi:hypothetical protein